jgi:hypothetical protein
VRGLSVELKVAVVVLTVCVLAGVGGAAVAASIFERNVEAATLTTLRNAADAFDAQERSDVEKLASTLDALLANDALREAFVARDRERLQRLAAPLLARMSQRDRISHWYFIEPEPSRTVFLRVHKPELFGDRVERVTLQRAVETRDLGAGKELGQTAFALRVVRAWFHEGKLLGYMELAEEIDHFLAAMKARTGDEYGLLVKKRFLDEAEWARVLGPRSNSWNDRPDVVVVDTTTLVAGIVDYEGDLEQVPELGQGLGEVKRGDRAYLRGIFPVRDAAERRVGGLFVLHDYTRNHLALRTGRVDALLALLAIGAATGVAVATLLHWLVFRRLGRLRRRLEARAAAAGIPPGSNDATGADGLGRLEALCDRALPALGAPGAVAAGSTPATAADDRR